jgi:outer membrane protein assembly factor BamB
MRFRTLLLPLVLCAPLFPQAKGTWGTNSGDPQRTNWQRNERAISKDSVKDLKLMWKVQLDNEPRSLHSILEPLVVPVIWRSLVIVPASSDTIYALDADLGKLAWKRHFEYTADKPQADATFLCPGGITATPVYSVAATGGAGRGRYIFAISGDGRLHEINAITGDEISTPAPFVPANSKPYGLNLVGTTLYTATGQKCGGYPNSVYAMDLSKPDKPVRSFATGGGGIWGLGGAAVGNDGTVYVETGDGPFDPAQQQYSDSFLALDGKSLSLKDYYAPMAAPWITKRDLDLNVTPVVFPWKGRDLIAGSGKEGRIYILDSKSLGGPDHRAAAVRSAQVTNSGAIFEGQGIWGGLATWTDAQGERWIAAPVWGELEDNFSYAFRNGEAKHGSIVAFKVVEEKDGKPGLKAMWASRDMVSPAPPVIANGVVMALATGEYTVQFGGDRVKNSTHAILYALDADTGKELYSSGGIVGSFTHFSGLAVADGAVYFGTYDNMFYAFGFPMEH